MNKYTPSHYTYTDDYQPVRGLQREVDSIFDNFFKGFSPSFEGFSMTQKVTPKINIAETEKEFEITLELPGVEQKDIDVQVAKGVMTIKGEKKEETKKEGKNFHRIERTYGSFQRSFTLPQGIDEDKISAKMEQGVLTVQVPKSPKAQEQVKKITIS